MSRRWNKFWIGLLAGVVLPAVVFFVVYFVGYSETPFGGFLQYAFTMQALPKILGLCVIPNLIIFYLFLNKEYWYATRGVIAATFFYTLVVVVLKVVV